MNWLTSRCAPLAVLAAALALAGCDKGTALNVDLPDTTAISTEYKDFPLVSSAGTVRLTPVQTLKTDHFLVGRLADNVAGTTEARAYFNLVSGGIPDSLPAKLSNPVLDSVVLVLGFDQVYGSTTAPVRFDVFRLAAPLDERQGYDATTATPLGAALGQNLTSRLDRTRPVTTAATATAAATAAAVPDPTVRLLLQRTAVPAGGGQPAVAGVPLALATDLFAQLSLPSPLFGQAQLDAVLKGLAVVPSAGYTGSIVSFGRTQDARLVVYYHGDSTPRRTYSARLGPVYSREGAAPARDPRYYTQLLNTLPADLAALAAPAGFVPATALGGTSYVQEGTGLGTRIDLAGLATLANQPGLTVNRAELRLPVKPFTNALFSNPARLFAVEVDANNAVLQRTVNFVAADRVVQADGFTQLGTANPAVAALVDATTTQPYYSLPITNYLQAYLNGKLDGNPAALVLVPNIRSAATLTLNRAALDAASISLRVYYSKR